MKQPAKVAATITHSPSAAFSFGWDASIRRPRRRCSRLRGTRRVGTRREAHRAIEGNVRDTAARIDAGERVVGGSTLEELAPGMVALLCKWWGWNRREQGEPRPEEKEDRRNQADRLIGYALEDVGGLLVDQHGAPHTLGGGAPVPLTSRCYSWLGPVAQAIIKFVEERGEYSGTSSELHSKLKPVAAQLGVDMD